MSYQEFLQWVTYREKVGTLNPLIRMDRGFARFCALYANSVSKNGGFKMWDFTPYEDEPPISLEQAMENWS